MLVKSTSLLPQRTTLALRPFAGTVMILWSCSEGGPPDGGTQLRAPRKWQALHVAPPARFVWCVSVRRQCGGYRLASGTCPPGKPCPLSGGKWWALVGGRAGAGGPGPCRFSQALVRPSWSPEPAGATRSVLLCFCSGEMVAFCPTSGTCSFHCSRRALRGCQASILQGEEQHEAWSTISNLGYGHREQRVESRAEFWTWQLGHDLCLLEQRVLKAP